jgi:hypothetical protein
MSCTQELCAKFYLKHSDIMLCLAYFSDRQQGRIGIYLLSDNESRHLFWYLGYNLPHTPQLTLNYENSTDILQSIVCNWNHLTVTIAKTSQPFRQGFTITWTLLTKVYECLIFQMKM